jgi:hypothetical protein
MEYEEIKAQADRINAIFNANRENERRHHEAVAALKEIWPQLGFDLEQARAHLRMEVGRGRKKIKASVLGMLNLHAINDWIERNPQRVTAHLFFQIADAGFEVGKSHVRRERAAKKNEGPRAWVRSEWQERADKGQSKAAFARQYAALVKHRFNLQVTVTADTIARDWLPKGK